MQQKSAARVGPDKDVMVAFSELINKEEPVQKNTDADHTVYFLL